MKINLKPTFQFIFVFTLFLACSETKEQKVIESLEKERNETSDFKLFEQLPASTTGVNFMNEINETPSLNYYTYKHMYIGGGVATGDFNNDGLEDIYFTGNLSGNKLYLNKGNLEFEDITKSAGVAGNTGFYMGITTVDINNDGWLDIYICKSGKYEDPRFKENLLYINNADLTFTESAARYGLNDQSQSVQASFFDYDLDGDLDVFIVNTPVDFSISQKALKLEYIYGNEQFKKLGGADKLFRNDGNGKFTDATTETGILPDLGFGLNVSVADYNNDNYPDIFVANDFIAPDYLYINQQDGTFKEQSKDYFKHTSFYSMGSDPSDINNDGLSDLLVLDMNPEDYQRSKTTMEMMDRDLFKKVSDAGYNNIYMQNMMHINTGMNSFSEISQLSGLSNTDWSWSCLVADYDNDGFKDVHITNGIYRDVLDRDLRGGFDVYASNKTSVTPEEVFEHLKSFPSQKLSNYIYKNNNGYSFTNLTEQWGMEQPSFSNGSALADFDNDGDMDIVINNLMDTAFVYKNNADKIGHNFIKVKLNGPDNNKLAYGARVSVTTGDNSQYQGVLPTKGYLSSTTTALNFGIGLYDKINAVKVTWPDGKVSELKDVKVNQVLTLDYQEAGTQSNAPSKDKLFTEAVNIFDKPFIHKENEFDDYDKQILLPYKYSRLGPKITVADVNGDGLDDFHVGGAAGQSGMLFVQEKSGEFKRKIQPALLKDKDYEDLGATFLDYDQDGDLDLYVASGGYEFEANDDLLQDRIYQNDGKGRFKKKTILPEFKSATSAVLSIDYDKDGDEDLLVGGRLIPGAYPQSPRSYLLMNDDGNFVDVTEKVIPELKNIGMVTAFGTTDHNDDDYIDFLVAGEWMKPMLFINQNGEKLQSRELAGLESKGWWQNLLINDFDSDNKDEWLFGNLGLNIKYKATEKKPFHIYASDFDDNEVVDVFLAKNIGERQVPVRGRECSAQQLPKIGEKFKTFESFAKADIDQILGEDIDNALHLEANNFETVLFDNSGDNYVKITLPTEVNISAIVGMDYLDVNNDGMDDLILAGNIFDMEVETTRLDSGTGLILINKGNNEFEAMASNESGFYVQENVKDVKVIRNTKGSPIVIVSVNDGQLKAFQLNTETAL